MTLKTGIYRVCIATVATLIQVLSVVAAVATGGLIYSGVPKESTNSQTGWMLEVNSIDSIDSSIESFRKVQAKTNLNLLVLVLLVIGGELAGWNPERQARGLSIRSPFFPTPPCRCFWSLARSFKIFQASLASNFLSTSLYLHLSSQVRAAPCAPP